MTPFVRLKIDGKGYIVTVTDNGNDHFVSFDLPDSPGVSPARYKVSFRAWGFVGVIAQVYTQTNDRVIVFVSNVGKNTDGTVFAANSVLSNSGAQITGDNSAIFTVPNGGQGITLGWLDPSAVTQNVAFVFSETAMDADELPRPR